MRTTSFGPAGAVRKLTPPKRHVAVPGPSRYASAWYGVSAVSPATSTTAVSAHRGSVLPG